MPSRRRPGTRLPSAASNASARRRAATSAPDRRAPANADASPQTPATRARAAVRLGASRSALVDAVRRAIVVEQVEERHRVERPRAEHSDTGPRPARGQLERDYGIDRRLPDDRLRAVAAHRLLVVDDVVEVGRLGLPVLAGAGDVRTGTGAPAHP